MGQTEETEHASRALSEDDEDLYRPIVIGYAFGAKKMNTMGMVLAEASRTKVWRPVGTSTSGSNSEMSVVQEEEAEERREEPRSTVPRSIATNSTSIMGGLTQAALRSWPLYNTKEDGVAFNGSYTAEKSLASVIRKFRSTCSSAGTNTNTDTTTSMSMTMNTSAAASPSQSQQQQLIRLSFVPLDPNVPVSEQHGGNFDLILHKLTQDIMSTSEDAKARIDRLVKYCRQESSACCLMDDPFHVRRLLSRDALCDTLRPCLEKLDHPTFQVRAPRYAVVSTSDSIANARQRLRAAGLTRFPLLAKPCTAAGTKQSHHMSILLRPEGMNVFLKRQSGRYILQEYRNHDATLFKVYVLGADDVRVFPRPSLPNLPMVDMDEHNDKSDDENSDADWTCVDFDSQRPYPTLEEFMQPTLSIPPSQLNAEDVQPIVSALQSAFGLNLFGFDVLMEQKSKLWVVDVNYFPSYKEVPEFPRLLAKYLTERVLARRSGEE